MIYSKEYNDSNWTASYIQYVASDFNSLLKYFCGYWETTKNFLSNIFSNEIIPDEKFQATVCTQMHAQIRHALAHLLALIPIFYLVCGLILVEYFICACIWQHVFELTVADGVWYM